MLPASDDQHCRAHFEREGNHRDDRSYEDVRPCYAFGHAAALDPAHNNRAFEEIEADLQKEWTEDNVSAHGDWAVARAYAREGYARGTTGRGGA
jgi:hypothetical protein